MNRFKFRLLVLLSTLPVVFMIVTSKGQAQEKQASEKKPAGKIKTIIIINGDTTITERDYAGWTEAELAEFEKGMKDFELRMKDFQGFEKGMKFRHFEKEMDSLGELLEKELFIEGAEGVKERTRVLLHDEDIELSPDGKQRIIIRHCKPGDSLRRTHIRMLDEHGNEIELPEMPPMPSMPPLPPMPPMPDVEKLLKERGALMNGKEEQVFIFEDATGEAAKRMVMVRMKKPDASAKKEASAFTKKQKELKANSTEPDNLKIYPNPSAGQFNLAFNTKEKGDAQVRILDMNGKEVYSETLKNFSGTYHHAFDLADATSGIYVVSVEQNGKRTLKKIVKEG